MNENENKLIRDNIKPLVMAGLLSASCIDEIKTLTQTTGKPTAMKDTLPEMLTQDEAMQWLKISRQTLYNWKRKNLIHPVKLAGVKMIRYRMEDLQNLTNPV